MRMNAERKFYLWLVVAAVAHVALLALSFVLQMRDARKPFTPKSVSITLVSLPSSGGGGDQAAAEKSGGNEVASAKPSSQQAPQPPAKKAEPKPLPSKKAVKEIAISDPKKVAKKSPDKKAPDAKPVKQEAQIDKALERLTQRVQENAAQQQSRSSLNGAFAQLQQKVKGDEARGGAGGGSGNGAGLRGTGGGGKGSGVGGISSVYKAKISLIIQKNWEFSKTLLKKSDGMEVYVRINILPDGTIGQIRFDKKAASEYFNNSVKKAIERSSPLPALPKADGVGDVWVGFVFTPAGIGRSGR